MSSPTSAATPANPIKRPSTRRRSSRSSPSAVTNTAAISGTTAINSPVVDEFSRVSAMPRNSHGPTISTAVYTSSTRQRRKAGPSSRRNNANGNNSSAPSVVRAPATTTGLRSVTATRIIRYGTPQMMLRAMNNTQPRRVTERLPPGLNARSAHR